MEFRPAPGEALQLNSENGSGKTTLLRTLAGLAPTLRRKQVSVQRAQYATCHVPPTYTEPGWNMHTAQEIGIDDFQANRAPDKRYRTTPLKGLWTLPLPTVRGRLSVQ